MERLDKNKKKIAMIALFAMCVVLLFSFIPSGIWSITYTIRGGLLPKETKTVTEPVIVETTETGNETPDITLDGERVSETGKDIFTFLGEYAEKQGNIINELTEPDATEQTDEAAGSTEIRTEPITTVDEIPEYSGDIYIEINGNVPYFSEDELTTEPFETYSDLDSLGRCGTAYANICADIMPTEERGEIGQIKPTGWHTVKYNGVVEGNYLYNRCHLIAFCLAGENANEKNLITGTRYFNVEGMLPFETQVADYVKTTNNHVLYRVTPIFQGDNLLASGVLMEAKSVEDNGAGVQFNVFVYNIQPQIQIDYATGESMLMEPSE